MIKELDAQVLAELEEYIKSVDFSLPGIECFKAANQTFRVIRSTEEPVIWIIPIHEEKPIKIVFPEQEEYLKGWWDANA